MTSLARDITDRVRPLHVGAPRQGPAVQVCPRHGLGLGPRRAAGCCPPLGPAASCTRAASRTSVAGIYRALGLHRSQHMRDQVEGMWLDGPVREGEGHLARGSLHVWYTSISRAVEAGGHAVPQRDHSSEVCRLHQGQGARP